MATDVWQFDRPKGRKPLWACRVTDGATVIFASRSVSLRLLSRDAARWLGRLVEAAHQRGCPVAATLEWTGDLEDDCQVKWKQLWAHAEHLQGRRRGGIWYCSVTGRDGHRFFHTIDSPDIQLRSGAAARWLCELLMRAADSGILEADTAE
jgi:hypothetical protein